MTFSSRNCRFVLFSFILSLSANAETIRGVHRELESAVGLGAAENYAILAKTGISTVPDSVITGNIGVSPIAATAITGFDLSLDTTGLLSTSTQLFVNGNKVHAASYGGQTAVDLTTAVSSMETAYTDAAGRLNTDAAKLNLGGGILGGDFGGDGYELTPGVYTFGTSVTIAGNIHFKGTADDIFIIQIEKDLMQAANYQVILEDGALAENIFWQVAGEVVVKAGAHMEGVLLVKTAVTFETGSSLNGRVLTQTACSLDQATIVAASATR
jgi:hypothetical protein